jgi:hypothetical protein
MALPAFDRSHPYDDAPAPQDALRSLEREDPLGAARGIMIGGGLALVAFWGPLALTAWRLLR